jgi:hypothetical protein
MARIRAGEFGMSDFGDFDIDDAFDNEPADPEQVAIKLHRYLREEDSSLPRWDDMSDAERLLRIAIMVRLLAWLRRQGAFR